MYWLFKNMINNFNNFPYNKSVSWTIIKIER